MKTTIGLTLWVSTITSFLLGIWIEEPKWSWTGVVLFFIAAITTIILSDTEPYDPL